MLPAFDIRLDNPVKGKEYLSIGDDCIVSGKFIFESKEGKISIGNHSYIDQYYTPPPELDFNICAGFPATTVHAGTSFVTILPAPTMAPSPIVTPFKMPTL